MIILLGFGFGISAFPNSNIPSSFVEVSRDSNSVNLIKKKLVRYASKYHVRFIHEDIAFLVNIQINKEGKVLLVRLIGEDIPIRQKEPFELFVQETLTLAVGEVEDIANRNFTIPMFYTNLYRCSEEKKEELRNRIRKLIDEKFDDSKFELEESIRCVYSRHKH